MPLGILPRGAVDFLTSVVVGVIHLCLVYTMYTLGRYNGSEYIYSLLLNILVDGIRLHRCTGFVFNICVFGRLYNYIKSRRALYNTGRRIVQFEFEYTKNKLYVYVRKSDTALDYT